MESHLGQPLLKGARTTTFAVDHGAPGDEVTSSPDASGKASASSTPNGRPPRRHVRAKSLGGLDVAVDTAHSWTVDTAHRLTDRVKDKVKDRLHDAQVKMLHKTEDRHAIYSGPSQAAPERRVSHYKPDAAHEAEQSEAPKVVRPAAPRRIRANSDTDALQSMNPTRMRSLGARLNPFGGRSKAPSEAVARQSIRFQRTLSEDFREQALMKRLGATVQESMAYMGIDWYQMQERQKRLSWLFIVENLYFWCYAGYIVTAILVGAVLIWALEPNGQLSFAQSVYSAAACVSQSGLAVVDWSVQSRSTYIVSWLLIIFGSASLLHMVPVLLRRLSFRMQTRMTQKLLDRLNRPSCSLETPLSSVVAAKSVRFQRANSDPGFLEEATQALPDALSKPTTSNSSFPGSKPAEERKPRRASTAFAFAPREQPSRNGDRRQGTVAELGVSGGGRGGRTAESLSEMHRLEYKALGKVLKIMTLYWLTVHVIGWAIFFMYFEFGNGPIQDKFRKEGLSSHWHAAYLTVSSFQNNGLVMTPSSVMDFRWSPLLLNTIGALILLGNTCLPISVRLIAWWLSRRAEPGSEEQHVLDFLLEHPRRCFTHMFPAVHTLWLLLVVFGLILIQTAVMLWQDSDGKAFIWWDDKMGEQQLGGADRFWNSLFQAMSTRTAGLNSVNVADLSQGTTWLMVVMMYFSTTPTVVTMRHSAASAGGHGELDITGRAEGLDEEVLLGDNSLGTQARRYLTQDITYLVFVLFLICVFEKDQFAKSAKEVTPDSDGIYGDFSFFKVVFELTSAYGTCGFSLGYRNQTSSFSGMWSAPSQYLLVVVMVLGRLRGLPDSIDPSVKVAMEHGEHAEHAFLHA